MRPGDELTQPRREDIDLTQQVIRVRRAVTWPDGQVYVGAPNSHAGIARRLSELAERAGRVGRRGGQRVLRR